MAHACALPPVTATASIAGWPGYPGGTCGVMAAGGSEAPVMPFPVSPSNAPPPAVHLCAHFRNRACKAAPRSHLARVGHVDRGGLHVARRACVAARARRVAHSSGRMPQLLRIVATPADDLTAHLQRAGKAGPRRDRRDLGQIGNRSRDWPTGNHAASRLEALLRGASRSELPELVSAPAPHLALLQESACKVVPRAEVDHAVAIRHAFSGGIRRGGVALAYVPLATGVMACVGCGDIAPATSVPRVGHPGDGHPGIGRRNRTLQTDQRIAGTSEPQR
jgi:hypothetical protein